MYRCEDTVQSSPAMVLSPPHYIKHKKNTPAESPDHKAEFCFGTSALCAGYTAVCWKKCGWHPDSAASSNRQSLHSRKLSSGRWAHASKGSVAGKYAKSNLSIYSHFTVLNTLYSFHSAFKTFFAELKSTELLFLCLIVVMLHDHLFLS